MYATIVALFVAMFAPTTAHALVKFDLWIAGTQVTSANCTNLSAISSGITGIVMYNPSTNILTLNNAAISSNTNAISSKIDGLRIKVINTNNLTTTGGWSTLFFTKPLTIMGDGELNVKSINYSAIYANQTNLTIENCTVNAEGKTYGIMGYNGSSEQLTIENAKVTAIGKDYGSICKFDELNMEGCAITQPVGATFSSSKHAVVLNGEIVKSKVVIQKVTTYDLTIAGVEVTSVNCDDLSAIDGVSGTVKYDPANKVLTLQNATISSNNGAIYSNINGLTIKAIGTNNLTSVGYTAIHSRKPLTIMGGGELNVKSNANCAIHANQTNLTIDNCTVNAEGKKYGIVGENGNNEEFTIKNATVTAIGTENGSILDFAKLNLIGCSITEPAGATFSSAMHAVVLNGEIVKSKVVIKKASTAIETPVANNKAPQGIYTLSGVRMSGKLKDLPKGVYIVNGKKIVKQ